MSFLAAASAFADNGRLEINQECAAIGCFDGDLPDFPVTLTTTGSYILTGNLSVSGSFTNGIQITADGVSLDLNGFTVGGSDDNSSVGISIEANEATITNGVVRDFTFGISRLTVDIHGGSSRVVGVKVISNDSNGVRLGPHSLIADCSATQNGQIGILLEDNSIVRGCTVADNGTGNTHDGIATGTNALVQGNTVVNNTGDGIFVRAGSAVLGNTVTGNGDNGINVSVGVDNFATLVRDNTSSDNTNYGINCTGPTLIISNALNLNRSGLDSVDILAGANCQIQDNVGTVSP